jgi:hypothetical protein
MAWLAFAILGVETMVWYKFSDEMVWLFVCFALFV